MSTGNLYAYGRQKGMNERPHCLYIQLFRERLSEKVHATIPKGIVGGFEFTRGLGSMFVSAKGKQQK